MANTQLSDVFVPVPFAQAVAELSANKAGVATSAAITTNNTIQSLMGQGGLRFELPFLYDTVMSNSSGNPSSDDSGDLLVTEKVSGQSQVAPRISRNFGWSTAKLAAQASGNDILGFAASRVGAVNVNSTNICSMNVLEGAVADSIANHGSDLILDSSGVPVTRDTIITAQYLIGDSAGDLGLIVMHPSLAATLKSEDAALWGYSQSDVLFQTYMGMRVILDQNITPAPTAGSADDFCAYLLGAGALQYGSANAETVIDLNNLAAGGRGIESLIYRKDEVIHLDGMSFTGSIAGDTVTDAELANGASWTRVYSDRRNIKLVKLIAGE
jgi:hypothetical protein